MRNNERSIDDTYDSSNHAVKHVMIDLFSKDDNASRVELPVVEKDVYDEELSLMANV